MFIIRISGRISAINKRKNLSELCFQAMSHIHSQACGQKTSYISLPLKRQHCRFDTPGFPVLVCEHKCLHASQRLEECRNKSGWMSIGNSFEYVTGMLNLRSSSGHESMHETCVTLARQKSCIGEKGLTQNISLSKERQLF